MISTKKLIFYITKNKSYRGGTRFTVKATLSHSTVKIREFREQACVITNHKFKDGKEKLMDEFHSFLKEMLETYELYKVNNDRVNFTMRFGDECSTWCSVGIGARPEDWHKAKYQLNCPKMMIPLSLEEINFFWNCIGAPILI